MNKTRGLFSPSAPEATQQTKLKEISRLREEARNYLSLQNKLVERVWALQMQSNEIIDKAEKAKIDETKNTLTKEINDNQYDTKYEQAIKSAMLLEIDVYGYSELSNSSFFIV